MIKRLIAILCAFTCLTASTVSAEPLYSDISEDSAEERVLNIVTGVGLMKGYTDGSFGPREHVTRAEVAQIIYNAVTQNFGGNSKTQETATSTFEWTDVDNSHWAYDAVNYVAELGIMVGDGNGSFRPEDTVTYREIIKTVLNLSGYEYEAEFYGGWPTGYEKIAANNNMNKGVSGLGDSKMSRMDVAKILYNLFALPVREIKWNGHTTTVDAKDETFMNDKMNVHAITGTLTSTDITSVDGSGELELYHAKLDGFEFIFNNDINSIRDYIGRNIRIFVYENEEEEIFELLCFEETGREDIIEIDSRYLVDFEDDEFKFYKDSTMTRTDTVKLKSGTHLIYNGKYIDTYTDEKLNIDKGSIKLIQDTALGYDILVIEDYTSGYTTTVDKAGLVLVDDLAKGTGDAYLKFASDTENIIYSIYDADGEPIDFKSLGTGVISYIKNGNYIKLYYSTETVSGKITREYSEDDEYYFEIDRNEYIINKEFYDIEYRLLTENGMTVTAYLDKWGEIVWVTGDVAIGDIGYFVSAVREDDGEKVLFKYYDLTSKSGAMTEVAERLIYSDENGNETKLLSYDAIEVAFDNYQGVFTYEKNAAGQITKVEIPLAIGIESNSQSRIRKMVESNEIPDSEFYKENLFFNSSLSGYKGATMFLDNSTVVLGVPKDLTDYESYTVKAKTAVTHGTRYLFSAYNFDETSVVADLMVIGVGSTIYSISPNKGSIGIVSKVETVYDSEQEEAVTQVTVTDGSTTAVLTPNIDYVDFTAVPSVYYAFGKNPRARYEIEVGDMVRYLIAENKVVNIQLLYDADAKNPAWYGADPADNIVDVSEIPDEDYNSECDVLGTIPGSTGFYTRGSYAYTNPFAYTNDMLDISVDYGEGSSHETYVYGFVYSYKEDILTVTTQNLSEGFSGDINADNYFADRFIPGTIAIRLIKKTRNGVMVSVGSINDIKTYQDAGVDCSRVMISHGQRWNPQAIYVFIEE